MSDFDGARDLRASQRARSHAAAFDPALLPTYHTAIGIVATKMAELKPDLLGKMVDADRTRCRRITEAQFVRELSAAGLGVSVPQVCLLSSRAFPFCCLLGVCLAQQSCGDSRVLV